MSDIERYSLICWDCAGIHGGIWLEGRVTTSRVAQCGFCQEIKKVYNTRNWNFPPQNKWTLVSKFYTDECIGDNYKNMFWIGYNIAQLNKVKDVSVKLANKDDPLDKNLIYVIIEKNND